MALARLNLLMTYPVKWSMEKVLTDYIQNFYDAVGPDRFYVDFGYSYDPESGELQMNAQKSFEKEWLMFMGASTKREKDSFYAGKFGEGFKIASLVAYRDYQLSVTMESGDWRIRVTSAEDVIGENVVKYLAYDISECGHISGARLTLRGISEKMYLDFQDSIKCFYYIQNPLFGECIHEDERCAVYGTLMNEGKYDKGRLFLNYQYRKQLVFPLIICDHWFTLDRDDRDRGELYYHEIYDCVINIMRRMDAQEAFRTLEYLRPFWSGRKPSEYKKMLAEILRVLIYIICGDDSLRKSFRSKYNEYIIAGMSKWESGHRKRTALMWFRTTEEYRRCEVVASVFSKFGIRDIETMCRKAGGFDIFSDPDSEESEYIEILKDAAESFFSDIYQYDRIPKCKVIINPQAPVAGLAHCEKKNKKTQNLLGLKTEVAVNNIFVKKRVILTGSFGEALAVYLHELLHQYGGDCSRQFHRALMIMDLRILEISERLKPYSERWKEKHLRYGRLITAD